MTQHRAEHSVIPQHIHYPSTFTAHCNFTPSSDNLPNHRRDADYLVLVFSPMMIKST